MAYPALFRHLFGDNPVRPFKFRKELIPLDVDAVETFRKSLIGCLIPTTMATLPSCLGIPDGSLFLFEDYPELKEKYDAGGFNGMLLESTATSEEKDAWRGKWIKHPQGLGLYSPRLSGLFLRNTGTVGRYNAAGLPDFIGSFSIRPSSNGNESPTGAVWSKYGTTMQRTGIDTSATLEQFVYTVQPSRYSSIYAASNTVMPASADVVIGLYLGRTA